MHVGGLSRTELVTHSEDPLTQEQAQRLHELLIRRKDGEPMAYLIGKREFWSMELMVSPATLIPRAETELLIEQALTCIPRDADWTIADIGTGCGAVALALTKERPRCRVIATDNAPGALKVARENALRLGLPDVEFRLGSWFAPLAGERIDVVVSNPPYIKDSDPHLTVGDARFEPTTALVAGLDGLDAIRHLTIDAKVRLRSGGWLLLEHGYDQATAVRQLMQQCGYTDISCYQDLAGLDRMSQCRVP